MNNLFASFEWNAIESNESNRKLSQESFACLMSTIETLEKRVKYVPRKQ